MKHKKFLSIALICLIGIGISFLLFSAHRPFKDLEAADITSASMGLPFRRHGYRDFVLRFGGKQSSTRRWFRVSWPWLNKLMVKFYV